ncbi:hypothetical protein TorRG33x02_335760, partial [Trema orientale]
MRGVYEEQCNTFGTFRKPFSPYSDTYNPGWRNHPNFSWKSDPNQPTSSNNNWSTEAQPPRSHHTPQYDAQQNRNPLEETLQAFMEAQNKTNQNFESVLTQVADESKEIKSQITNLTSALTIQERGRFLSQPYSNPKGQHIGQTSTAEQQNLKDVNAITTQSRKVLNEPTLPPSNTNATILSNTEDIPPQGTEKKSPVQV